MATLSVKVAEETKAKLYKVAAEQGRTPHAVMVAAIEGEIARQEQHQSFVAEALAAREEMISSGSAYDGDEVLAYARARLAGRNAKRPARKPLKKLLNRK